MRSVMMLRQAVAGQTILVVMIMARVVLVEINVILIFVLKRIAEQQEAVQLMMDMVAVKMQMHGMAHLVELV
jgi:hypothetical protein